MTNSKVLVSIITPVYNSEKFLKSTILSVINQSVSDWEMIAVDDYSSDNSVNILKELSGSESRLKLVSLPKNCGVANARNVAIEKAVGRYIAFLDSDDVWYSDKLEKQLKFMQINDLSFSYTAYDKIDINGDIVGFVGVPNKLNYHDLLKTCYIGCLTAMYDTDKIGKFLMPNGTKREDYATWLNIIKEVNYAYGINESLAQYRVYSFQGSSKKLSMAKENFLLYRNFENLNLFSACYYFLNYALRGFLRTRFPFLSCFIGVLHKPKKNTSKESKL